MKYCLSKGGCCPCGKSGLEIIRCRKPFSDERMAALLDEMIERLQYEEKRLKL